MAEDSVFKNTHNYEFKEIPRNTYKFDLYKIYKDWKQTLIIILFSFPYSYAITSDCGQDLSGNYYLSVTAHYIDND